MKHINSTIILLILTLLVTHCSKGYQTSVDQTVYVYSVDGKPLQGIELNLSGHGLTPSKWRAMTDSEGKANFTFDWEQYHESGVWNWFIDATSDGKMMQINRVRDFFQRSDRNIINPDTIRMDSLVPFKIRFRSKDKIKAYNYDLLTKNGRDKFIEIQRLNIAPQILDTIVTIKVFKQTAFEIAIYYNFADYPDPNAWGSKYIDVPKNARRDSILEVQLFY